MRSIPRLRLALGLAACTGAGDAPAHEVGEHAAEVAWSLEPWIALPLAASLVLYAAGLWRLWSRAGVGRGMSLRNAAFFACGWLTLAVALLSPVDTLGGELFSMHMVQHELVMVVAAPLFVLSRPLEAWAWGMAPAWRCALGGVARSRLLRGVFGALTTPAGAWTFHAVVLWGWHAPTLFDSALRDEAVHALQHASFLAAALAFWWSTLPARAQVRGASLASVFTTMLHTGALGALLTFAPHPWYAGYAGAFGLTALEDQQLGGLVMWVPGGLAYLIAGLVLVSAWLTPREAAAHRT